MTHEELLAKIDYFIKYQAPSAVEFFDAIRAVVELHTPTAVLHHDIDYCYECSFINDGIYTPYPCPTIGAIEKELK